MKTKITGVIFIAIITVVLGFIIFSPAEKFFLAAVSNANVYVPGTQENNPPPVVSVGGGGSYYPTVITPTLPPEQEQTSPAVVVQPEQPNVVENPVISSENTQQPSPTASLLPLAVANLSQKIPQFQDILDNLKINSAEAAENLSSYNIFVPGLKEITGGNDFSSFTPEQKDKIPSGAVFVMLGNKNIDALAKVDFSRDAQGAETVSSLVGKKMHLVVKPESEAKEVSGNVFFTPSNLSDASQKYSVLKFNYVKDIDGVYNADIISPSVEGQYQIVTTINYVNPKLADTNIKTTTLIDPDGYIYENIGGKELRINNAVVSLYKLNDKNQYDLWNAKDYGQENPQITDSTGKYSFLVPVGTYYLAVKSDGYYSYKSDVFSVMEGKEVHMNVALKNQTSVSSFFNWEAIAIIILFCLVIYNFYKDWRRGTVKIKK